MAAIRSSEFRHETEPPRLFMNPIQNRGVDMLRGEGSGVYSLRQKLHEIVGPVIPDGELNFVDTENSRANDLDWMRDRFQDASGYSTGSVSIGPTEQQIRAGDSGGSSSGSVRFLSPDERVERFYRETGLSEPVITFSDSEASEQQNNQQHDPMLDGYINKATAAISIDSHVPRARILAHELGHATMGLIGVSVEKETTFDKKFRPIQNYFYSRGSSGLTHVSAEGIEGGINEEAIAESIGATANEALRLSPNTTDESVHPLFRRHMDRDGSWGASSPAAVAFDLMAEQIGMPREDFVRHWVDYANAGVHDLAARQEIGDMVLKGTNNRITLAHFEGLPYPSTPRASFAPLIGVEQALEIPEKHRPSRTFAGE